MELRILFVTTGLSRGGAEVQVVQLARRHHARGHSVTVVSMLPPGSLESELREAEIPIIYLNMKPGVPNPFACVRLARAIHRFKPDIVHSHMVHANLLARLTRLFCPIPVLICTAHSIYEVRARARRIKDFSIRDFLYGVTDRLADITTQVCQAGADRYVRIRAASRKRMRVIYNGLDVQRFHPDPDTRAKKRREFGIQGEWIWLAVGRLEEAKDYFTLLQAFATLRGSKTTDRLFIVGDGRLRDAMEEKCMALGIQDAVSLLGARTDVAELMQAADAFVMSSIFEGLPLVLMEALASGLPAVATRVGGVPEIVPDGASGFLCPPSDPEALARAMLRLRCAREDDLLRMRSLGREAICQKFALDGIVGQWEDIYHEVLAKVRSGHAERVLS